MWIVITALIVLGFLACAGWIWLCSKVYRMFAPKSEIENPYVKAHKLKMLNDRMYSDYQDWMAKHGDGVPIPKVMAPEDVEAEEKINKMFK